MAVECLYQLSLLNTIKLWRTMVWDYFLDPNFFQQSPTFLSKWKQIMQTLLRNEKERFIELLVRVSSTPTTNLFMSKDMEVRSRVVSLKRIGFSIHCSEIDQLLPVLPSIQEKLSEILKIQSKSMQIEVKDIIYLFLNLGIFLFINSIFTNFVQKLV